LFSYETSAPNLDELKVAEGGPHGE